MEAELCGVKATSSGGRSCGQTWVELSRFRHWSHSSACKENFMANSETNTKPKCELPVTDRGTQPELRKAPRTLNFCAAEVEEGGGWVRVPGFADLPNRWGPRGGTALRPARKHLDQVASVGGKRCEPRAAHLLQGGRASHDRATAGN